MHELRSCILGRERLVDERVWVFSKIPRVILKVVLLAGKELVDLGEPRGIHGLGLRTVMGVILITEISISDIGILRSINVEVLLLVILDGKQFILRLITVFAEECLHGRGVHGGSLHVHQTLVDETKGEEVKDFPADGHTAEPLDSVYSLKTKVKSCEVGNVVISIH